MKWIHRANVIGVFCERCKKSAPDHIYCKNCAMVICMHCLATYQILVFKEDPYPHLDIVIKGVIV